MSPSASPGQGLCTGIIDLIGAEEHPKRMKRAAEVDVSKIQELVPHYFAAGGLVDPRLILPWVSFADLGPVGFLCSSTRWSLGTP